MYEGHGLYQERVISVLWEALCKRINKVDRTALVRSTHPTSAPPQPAQLNTFYSFGLVARVLRLRLNNSDRGRLDLGWHPLQEDPALALG